MSFKRLEPEDFLVSNQSVSQTVWSGNQPSLFDFKILDQQKYSPSGKFYLSVYSNINSASGGIQNRGYEVPEEVQFDIAYANKEGKYSTPYNIAYPTKSPSSTIYGQYRTLLMEDEDARFIFNSGDDKEDENDFFVISINRSRFKEKLLPGSFNISLSDNPRDDDNDNTYNSISENFLHLTDNSSDVNIPEYYGTQRVYKVIIGRNGKSDINLPNYDTQSYGWFLPDIGTILISVKALKSNSSWGSSYSVMGNSSTPMEDFYRRILRKNPDVEISASSPIKGFTLNSEETISSDYVFVHVRHSEFNYSENPSFIKGSNGELFHDSSINNPQVYPTTIGLYNDSNELIAVAKLSRPLLKDFTKEANFRIKIDF